MSNVVHVAKIRRYDTATRVAHVEIGHVFGTTLIKCEALGGRPGAHNLPPVKQNDTVLVLIDVTAPQVAPKWFVPEGTVPYPAPPAPTFNTFTPVLTAVTTNPNLGTTGTATGRYSITKGWCTYAGIFTFGGTGVATGSGIYSISLPAVPESWTSSSLINRGGITFRNTSGSLILDAAAVVGSNLQARYMRTTDASSNQLIGSAEAAFSQVPFGVGSILAFQIEYTTLNADT